MSEGSPAAAAAAPVAAPAVEAAVDPAAAGAWEGLMAQMAKQPGFPGAMGGVPFSMPFPQVRTGAMPVASRQHPAQRGCNAGPRPPA